jgi:hypothetical protein
MTSDHPARALVHCFKQVPGCVFASSFAAAGLDGRISFATFPDLDSEVVEDINRHLDGCGRKDRAACMIFPSVTFPADPIGLLGLLAAHERWRCRRLDAASEMLRLERKTAFDCWSQTLGLAPLLSMPVTRRTRYVAIALCPGKAKKAKHWAGFIDMPSKMTCPPRWTRWPTDDVIQVHRRSVVVTRGRCR